MSKYHPGDRRSHRTFCETEGWQERPSARGRRGQDHVMYELALLDGRVLLTRISHPVNRTTYSRSMWAHILRDQLDVTDDAFWACVDDGVVPARGTPDRGDERSLPLWLVAQLTDAGVPMAELATMSEAQAKSRLAAIWGAPDSGSSPHPELSERGEP